jgi:hypothetical protein
MIDAGKFAKVTPPNSGENGFFRFSIDKEGAARELRRLADAIEQNRIVLQKVQSGGVADRADYHFQALMIEFAEREIIEKLERDCPTAGNPVGLFGSHQLPVDVQYNSRSVCLVRSIKIPRRLQNC